MKIKKGKTEIEVTEEVPELYESIAELTNPILQELKYGISTWIEKDPFEKMNVSVWIQNDIGANAFSVYENGRNYIVLTVGLCKVFWDEIEEFVGRTNFKKVFTLSDEKKDSYKRLLYIHILNFIIAHEFGHIVHGHLLVKSSKGFVEEFYNDNETLQSEEKWKTQLQDFDADIFAAMISSSIILENSDEQRERLNSNIDFLCLIFYLSFDVFAKKFNRNFSNYLEEDITTRDHPYPGIRMYYSIFSIIQGLMYKENGLNEIVLDAIKSGIDAVISYERQVLEKDKFKESYFSVGGTKKGVQHIMNLVNGWNKLADSYAEYSYIPLYKTGDIKAMSYFINEIGDFIQE